MYRPAAFTADDPAEQYDLIRKFSFGMLVTVVDNWPVISHLPFLLDENRGTRGTLIAHMARANPQWHSFDTGEEALAVFQGPHAYISPAWYSVQPAVPTWNYAVVHAAGVPRIVSDARLREIVLEAVETYESGRENPWEFDAPEPFTRAMLNGIVGFEMELTRIEGKFKMSQNRPEQDRTNVVAALSESAGPLDQETARFMQALRTRSATDS